MGLSFYDGNSTSFATNISDPLFAYHGNDGGGWARLNVASGAGAAGTSGLTQAEKDSLQFMSTPGGREVNVDLLDRISCDERILCVPPGNGGLNINGGSDTAGQEDWLDRISFDEGTQAGEDWLNHISFDEGILSVLPAANGGLNIGGSGTAEEEDDSGRE